MRKWIDRVFNFIVYVMLIFSLINGAYLALDPEIQAQYFGWYNDAYAWVNAIWSGAFGLGGSALIGFMKKAQKESDDRYIDVVEKYNLLHDGYKSLERKVDNQTKVNIDLAQKLERNNKLQEANLEAKKSNVLIDEEVKRRIDEVLGDEDEE